EIATVTCATSLQTGDGSTVLVIYHRYMKLLVIGSGMMGSAAAFDMARQDDVEQVTLADADIRLAKAAVNRISKALSSIGRKADGEARRVPGAGLRRVAWNGQHPCRRTVSHR